MTEWSAWQRQARQAVLAAMSSAAWTNADLAREAEVDPKTVNSFVAGKRWPHLGTRGRIERALGLPAGTLSADAEDAVSAQARNRPVYLSEIRELQDELRTTYRLHEDDLLELREELADLHRQFSRLEQRIASIGEVGQSHALKAARRGTPGTKAVRDAQDGAETGSQDDGRMEPS